MLSTLSNVSELLLAKGFEEMLQIFHNPITVHKQRVVQYTQLESIRLWYLRFDKLEIDSWTLFHRIDTNHFPFCRFKNRVDLDFEGGLKMLSIRVDSIESTRVVRIDWSLVPRFKNEEGSCTVYRYFTDLDFRWAMQGGLKMLSIRVDSIESTRTVYPVVDSSCRKSICETRLRANRVEM